MVSNKFLASLAVKLDFHRHLRKNGTGMVNAIQLFVNDVREAELAAEGSVDYWANVSGSIPKVSQSHTLQCNLVCRLTPPLTPE